MVVKSLAMSVLRIGLVLIGAGLTTACSDKLGPDFVAPAITTSPEWLNAGPAALKQGPAKNWWSLFEDPVLDRLMGRAFEQNLDVRAAAVRILEARAQLGIARSLMFPQHTELRGDAGYDQLSEKSPYFLDLPSHSFPYYQTSLDTAWEIDLWGKFRRGIEASSAQLAIKALEYDDLLVSLTAEVATAYIQIRTFEERLRIARQNADLQKHTYEIAKSQYENGINTELDMQQANALYQRTLAEITHLESGLKQSIYALCQLLGLAPSNLEQTLSGSKGIPEVHRDVFVGIPADILRRRPDVRKAAFEAASESAQIGIAKSELFPSLTLLGSVGYAAGHVDAVDLAHMSNPSGLAGKIGPTIRWPVFQFGRLRNNVRAQDARFQSALTLYRNTVLRALREVEEGLVENQQSKIRVERLGTGVAASRRAAELALLQYQNGLEDYIRVLNAELFLVDQQDKWLTSRGDVARTLVLIYKALGGGWEIREGKPLLPSETLRVMKERTDWGQLLDEPVNRLTDQAEQPQKPEDGSYFESWW